MLVLNVELVDLWRKTGDSGNEVFQVQHILRKVQQCPHFQCCFKVSGVRKPTHENFHPNTSESVLARGVTVSSHCLVLWKSRTRRSGETKRRRTLSMTSCHCCHGKSHALQQDPNHPGHSLFTPQGLAEDPTAKDCKPQWWFIHVLQQTHDWNRQLPIF